MKNNLTNSTKKKSGIYIIRNLKNGKKYVGKTKCFQNRFWNHSSAFNTLSKKHTNQYLINSVNKYGKENFIFETLEVCKLENCAERELYWMKKLNTTDKNVGYNLRMDSSTGMIVHKSTKKKYSINSKKAWEDGYHKDHSKKLKTSWSKRGNKAKKAQANVMSKNFSKYHYFVECDKYTDFVNPKQLKELGLQNVTHKFCVYKTDRVSFKGVFIRRIKIEDIVSSNVKALE